jgi:hypothetical protein
MKHAPKHFTTGGKKGRHTVKTVGNTTKKKGKKNRRPRRYLFLTHQLELTHPNQAQRQQKWRKKKEKKNPPIFGWEARQTHHRTASSC